MHKYEGNINKPAKVVTLSLAEVAKNKVIKNEPDWE